MTNMTRWEPFNDMLKLSTAMDQLFNSAFVPAFGRGSQTLPVDVFEREDAYTVQVVVPGIDPNDLDITVNDQALTIKGEWKQAELPQGATFPLRERSTGRFERTIQFPLSLNADAVQARYEHGILMLTLPKAESVKPRRIAVQSQPRQIETTAQPEVEEQVAA
jgi:HSP20 family protein